MGGEEEGGAGGGEAGSGYAEDEGEGSVGRGKGGCCDGGREVRDAGNEEEEEWLDALEWDGHVHPPGVCDRKTEMCVRGREYGCVVYVVWVLCVVCVCESVWAGERERERNPKSGWIHWSGMSMFIRLGVRVRE